MKKKNIFWNVQKLNEPIAIQDELFSTTSPKEFQILIWLSAFKHTIEVSV